MKHILDEIIKSEKIRTVFQPIVSLLDANIIGYEALSRGPEGSPLERPDSLFRAAEENNMIWELDYLCRIKALEKARRMLPDKMLFINVDPKVMHNENFKSGFTKDFLIKSSIDPTNIIFEITERTCIEDYKTFRSIIDNYIGQGYKIAIDDTGAGYSGLRMLAETHPQYIKLDMDIIRDIDKKEINQALVKSLVQFASETNIKVIAEGIETIDELNILINFGVHFGQGYLLQKPSPEFLELNPRVREMIIDKHKQRQKQYYHSSSTMPIGQMARLDTPISPYATGRIVNEMFNTNPAIQGIPVVETGLPIGLIMRNDFYATLATQYGIAVFMNRPIRLLMNKNPLIVDYNISLTQVSKTAIRRREENLYDYIIITKDCNYYGITTVKSLLEYTTELELNTAKHSNPLTGLPGNIIIEQNIKDVIYNEKDSYILYFDLDNFKAYNDVYGFENGDKIITFTANVINECLSSNAQGCFLGHIGGDDFVAILETDDIDKLCSSIIDVFDNKILNFYTEFDRSNGYITAKNRHGIEERFPIVSISIAVIKNTKHKFNDAVELSERLSILKKKCKLQWFSCYHIA